MGNVRPMADLLSMIALPNRLRTAARLLTGPSAWWLALRTVWWLAVLPILKRVLPLPRLAHLMWSGGSADCRQPDREELTVAIVRGFSRSSGGNCLERSLVLYRFLSRANANPELVAGMSKPEDFIGHAWVEVEGRPLLETPEAVAPYVEVMRFGVGGRLSHPRAAE